MKKGYSVIEILVVVGVFAVLGVIATQAISLTLKSSKKNDSMVLVKQDLDNAAGNIERLLQTASTVIVGGDCTTPFATPSVGFRDSTGLRKDIACFDSPPHNWKGTVDSRIVISSGETIRYFNRFTPNAVQLSYCNFSCYTKDLKTYVDFTATASARGVTGIEGASFETSRKIIVREAIRR